MARIEPAFSSIPMLAVDDSADGKCLLFLNVFSVTRRPLTSFRATGDFGFSDVEPWSSRPPMVADRSSLE